MPERLQLRRAAGWRLPAGAVKVDRSTRWGNPWRIQRLPLTGETFGPELPWRVQGLGFALLTAQFGTEQEARAFTIERFRVGLIHGQLSINVELVRRELAGHDLACWCRIGLPCHADVLLEVANNG